jgi:SAM-dependent methyltransferase
MVHALEEAHRVLKPDGILIDLRPAPAHRQLGLGVGRRWQRVGSLHEILDDDHAADAAVATVVRRGMFRPEKRTRFMLDRVLDSAQEVRDFIVEFDQRRDNSPHERLVARLERQHGDDIEKRKVSIRGPMHLAVFSKLPAPQSTRKERS